MLLMSFATFFRRGWIDSRDPDFLSLAVPSNAAVLSARAQLHTGSGIGSDCFQVLSGVYYVGLKGLGLANRQLQKLGPPLGGSAPILC